MSGADVGVLVWYAELCELRSATADEGKRAVWRHVAHELRETMIEMTGNREAAVERLSTLGQEWQARARVAEAERDELRVALERSQTELSAEMTAVLEKARHRAEGLEAERNSLAAERDAWATMAATGRWPCANYMSPVTCLTAAPLRATGHCGYCQEMVEP